MGAETDVAEPMSSDDVRAADNETANEPSRDQQRKRKKHLYKSIQDIMEFYMGDVNLSKNRFIYHHIQGKPFVYMDLAIFLTFNKIKALTSKVEDLASALTNSELLQVSEDGTHVCRKIGIQRKENEDECTIYVEGLSPEMERDALMKIFSAYGPVDYISIPKFPHSNKNKGFGFVEFKDPEVANKALEVLCTKGCWLSPDMAPGELMSVKCFELDKRRNNKGVQSKLIKFDDDNQNDGETHTKTEVTDHNTNGTEHVNKKSMQLKRKLSNEASDGESEASNNDETSKSMKGKKKRKCSESEETGRKRANLSEVGKVEPETSTRESKSSKRKHSVDETERRTSENAQPAEKKSKPNQSVDESAEESKMEDEEGEKEGKKRKKRKKVKKDKVTAVSLGLKVISKVEWKMLRNKYLNMQRDTMRSLKQQLSYSKLSSRETEPIKTEHQVNTVPGTVVKITLDQPVSNNKATKNEMRVHPEIRYVDVTEGSNVVYLRTSTSELASSILESKHWPTMEIISGEEETEYWNKIGRDRKEHFDKAKPNCRGRTKLLKKAERIQGANTFEASTSQT